VEETANATETTAHRLLEISQGDRARVQGVGRIVGSALQLHHALLSRPINTIARLAKETGLSVPPVTGSLKALEQLGLGREITGRKRGRVFKVEIEACRRCGGAISVLGFPDLPHRTLVDFRRVLAGPSHDPIL